MASFFEIGLAAHPGKENQLVKLGKLLDWQRFSVILQGVHKEDGPTGYDTLKEPVAKPLPAFDMISHDFYTITCCYL